MKRILIISGGLQLGGAERVAANISLYAPEEKYQFDYLIFEGVGNDYGPEIEKKGGRVLTIPSPGKGYGAYIRNLSAILKENRYTAVHSHTMFNSGLNLLLAKCYGVPVRIAHSHTTKTETPVSCPQKIYEKLMQALILAFSTDYYACGREAGRWLFGKARFDRKGIVIFNGIDTKSFAWSVENRKEIRNMLGLKEHFVIGHSGTLLPLKNQQFLIRLLPKIRQIRKDTVLVLLGAGQEEYRRELENLAADLGVREYVKFCGGVGNVNAYLSAFDVFAFPSTREGTPLALLEAQTNGLPCIISNAVPNDAYLTDLITALPLQDEDKWIQKICSAQRNQPDVYAGKILKSGYDAKAAYQPIYEAYDR